MAQTFTINNYIAHGIANVADPTILMNWYRTNFNMPVKDIFNGGSTYTTVSTLYDLSSFVPGYEICVGISNFSFTNTDTVNWYINCYIYQGWYGTDFTTELSSVVNGYNYVRTLLPNYNVYFIYAGNIGCAPWEVSVSGTYYFRSKTTGNPASSSDTAVTMSNVPVTTQLSSDKAGHIWVEGNNLAFVNANRWKHSMVGTLVDSLPGTSKTGSIWLDGTVLHWVGGDGNNYKANWQIKQFASTFSNSATGSTFAGTAAYGAFWVDNEFGDTHLAYIGSDGYKYLTGAGNNPYI